MRGYWATLSTSQRVVHALWLGLAVLAAVALIPAYLGGWDYVLGWNIVAREELVTMPWRSFRTGLLELSIPADYTFATAQMLGGEVALPLWFYTALLGLTVAVLVFLLALCHELNGLWFYLAVGLYLFLCSQWGLETLQLFENISLAQAIVLVAGPSVFLVFGLRYFWSEAGLMVRLALHALVFAGLAVVVWQFSSVEAPFLYLGTYGLFVPVLLAVGFIVFISGELIVLFLWLITARNTAFSQNSLRHFLIISFILILNLLAAWMDQGEFGELGLVYVHSFVLLVLAAGAGFVFLERRMDILARLGVGLSGLRVGFAALATLTFFLVAGAAFSGQDPLKEALADVTTYTFWGMSTVMLGYAILNFGSPLARNLRVFEVYYKPKHMPLVTARIGGLVFAFILFWNSAEEAYRQVRATRSNAIGDMNVELRDAFVASQYYESASYVDPYGHKSNYAMAKLAEQQREWPLAANYYERAGSRQGSKYALANWAYALERSELPLQANFALKEGQQAYPDVGALANNRGVVLSYFRAMDSVAYQLSLAALDPESAPTARGNLLGLLGKAGNQIGRDSLAKVLEMPQHAVLQSNALLASAPQPRGELSLPTFEAGILTANDRRLYRNAALTFPADTALLRVSRTLAVQAQNTAEAVMPFQLYASGRVNEALFMLDQGARTDPYSPVSYYYVSGLMALDQANYRQAVQRLQRAFYQGLPQAGTPLALALMHLGMRSEALLVIEDDSTATELYRPMQAALRCDEQHLDTLSQEAQVYWHLSHPQRRLTEKAQVLLQPANQAVVWLHWAALDFAAGRLDSVSAHLAQLGSLQLSSGSDLGLEARVMQARLMALTGDTTGLARAVGDLESHLQWHRPALLAFFRGVLAQDAEVAKEHFLQAAENGFLEQELVLAAGLVAAQGLDLEAYQLLGTALGANPESPSLLQQHALLAASYGFDDVVTRHSVVLERVLSAEQLAAFRQELRRIFERNEEFPTQW